MTLIDHIYTNKVHNMVTSGIVTYDLSDHLGTYITISLRDDISTLHHLDSNHEYSKFNDENLSNFKSFIENQCWDDVLNEPDTQLKYDKFIKMYTNLYDTAFPKTSARRKMERKNPKPWILPWLEDASHRKNLLYAQFVIEPTEAKKTTYEHMKKFITKHIKIAKNRYYKRYFDQYSSNSKKQWQMLNSLLNRNKNKKSAIKLRVWGHMVGADFSGSTPQGCKSLFLKKKEKKKL